MSFETVDTAQQCRLAGAGRTTDDQALPVRKRQRKIGQHTVLAKPFIDAIGHDQRRRLRGFSGHWIPRLGQNATRVGAERPRTQWTVSSRSLPRKSASPYSDTTRAHTTAPGNSI